MDVLNFIQWLVTGGGLIAIISLPYAIKKAKAEADASVTDNYEKYLERVEKHMKENDDKIDRLTEKTEELSRAVLAAFRCPIITKHPDNTCPVQDAYNNMNKEIKS